MSKAVVVTGAVRQLPLDQLETHPHEQAARLLPSALAGLEEDIQASGYISPIVVVKRPRSLKHVIIDGNRRHEIAKKLGRTSMTCEVLESDSDIDVLFVQLNAHPRRMGGNEKLQFLASADPSKWKELVALMPKSFAVRLRELEDAVGRPYVIKMGREGRHGPEVMQYVHRIQAALIHHALVVDNGDLVKWLLDHRMQGIALVLTRQNRRMVPREARRLAKCVTNDIPFRMRNRTGGKRAAALALVATKKGGTDARRPSFRA